MAGQSRHTSQHSAAPRPSHLRGRHTPTHLVRHEQLHRRLRSPPHTHSFFYRDASGVGRGRRCRQLSPHVQQRQRFSVSVFGSHLPLWLVDRIKPAKPSKPRHGLRLPQDPAVLGLARATAAGVLWITEGEMDALSLLQCGMANVVSVPNGAPVPPAKDPSLVDVMQVVWGCRC